MTALILKLTEQSSIIFNDKNKRNEMGEQGSGRLGENKISNLELSTGRAIENQAWDARARIHSCAHTRKCTCTCDYTGRRAQHQGRLTVRWNLPPLEENFVLLFFLPLLSDPDGGSQAVLSLRHDLILAKITRFCNFNPRYSNPQTYIFFFRRIFIKFFIKVELNWIKIDIM